MFVRDWQPDNQLAIQYFCRKQDGYLKQQRFLQIFKINFFLPTSDQECE